MRPAILIHGPTASGKTALAIALARRLDGEIVNADAMQVYADLNVLTARPTPGELEQAPHHLFGHVDGAERFSAGRWLKDAAPLVAKLREAGRTPILVGGTGLYLQALVEGLSDIPAIPEPARAEARRRVADDESAAYAEIVRADPAGAARIEPGDRQRIARALEVLITTGRPISAFQGQASPTLPPGAWLGVALTPPRATTYDRVNRRVDAMIANGALDEAQALWARQLDRELPVMRAHGMPGFSDYFDRRVSLADAVERCKRDTRRYAKRQLTWITNQFVLWPRIPAEGLDARVRVIIGLMAEVRPR